MVMLLLELITYLGNYIYIVTTVSSFLWVVLPFIAVILGPYFLSALMGSSKVTGQLLMILDLTNLLK